jgi:hypothetical protein
MTLQSDQSLSAIRRVMDLLRKEMPRATEFGLGILAAEIVRVVSDEDRSE